MAVLVILKAVAALAAPTLQMDRRDKLNRAVSARAPGRSRGSRFEVRGRLQANNKVGGGGGGE